MNTESGEPTETAILACSKCGASLPDEAQFCLKCGKPVSSPASKTPVVEVIPPATLPQRRRSRKSLWWLLLLLFFVFVVWVVSSDTAPAQGIQELIGWKHDQTILDTPFTVGAHTFRYYKFSLPEGSVNVAIVGDFSSTAAEIPISGHKQKDAKGPNQTQAPEPDNGIQVYVLTESAFTIWQQGYATGSLYDSGNVSQGNIHGDLPAGAGIYYLVFNNKPAPKASKSIHATVLLHYKSWLPEWYRSTKERFMNWVGS
ncbi:MAG TPA: zinc ribbon domain-containing protein [Candidatus Solibacter sp.]|nr:zinc ribbon domain-containing protein [Candidatus Solibacter sp.]